MRFCPFREEAVLADIFTFFAKFDHPVISTEIGFFLFFGKKGKKTLIKNLNLPRCQKLSCVINRSFRRSCLPPLQSESKCKALLMKISFHSYVKWN